MPSLDPINMFDFQFKHLYTDHPRSSICISRESQAICIVYNSYLMYAGQTFRMSFIKFKGNVRESRKVVYPYIIGASNKYGSESFLAFSIKHGEDNFASASDFY